MARNVIGRTGRAQSGLPGNSGGFGKTDGAPGKKGEATEKEGAAQGPQNGMPGKGSTQEPQNTAPGKKTGASRRSALLAVGFWLCVWQAASLCIGQKLLLASPIEVCRALLALLPTAAFWQRAAFSAARIIAGFLLALAAGSLCAVGAAVSRWAEALLRPLMLAVRAVPVASFIILALLWLRGTGGLSVFISFLMVLPVVYQNVLAGIRAADEKLLEMAAVFRVPLWRRMRALYAPAVLPYFRSACAVGLGLCWKSGVAAEVIGISGGSIGEALYNAKLLFATDELLAWTVVIVLLSLAFERLFLRLLSLVEKRLIGDAGDGRSFLLHASAALHPQRRPELRRMNEPQSKALVELQNVYKCYNGVPVLRGVSLALACGAPVCVTGRSGIGKTTLLRLMLGLEQPDSGAVLVREGVRFSAVFQENRLIEHLSAADNVRFVCPPSAMPDDAALAGAFAAVGLTRQEMQKKASELSGGQQRRTALLRALLAPADAVLLDEPFTGLDAAARRAAAAYIAQTCAHRALLCITHERRVAALLGARVFSLEETSRAFSPEETSRRLPSAAFNSTGYNL